jgi:peptide/nickel transport system ATP-binding protein/peptide/nickel transport system permease protein
VASGAWLLLVLICAVFAGQIAPYNPQLQDLAVAKSDPARAHWLGTDQLGRDVLSQLIYGAQPALIGVVCALASWLLLGVTFGVLAGYLRGPADTVVSRVTELLMALPGLVILLVVFSIFPNAFAMPMLLLGALGSAGLARVVRAVTMSVRDDLYVQAARVLGQSSARIMTRHILPRVASAVIVQAGVFCALALIIQSGLAFLGFGVALPKPSWGGVLNEANQLLLQFPWLIVPCGVVLGLTALAFVLFGNAVRDTWTERWAPSQLSGTPGAGKLNGAVTQPGGTASAVAAEPAGAVLAVRGLGVEFPGRPVVSDVSFAIGRGETLVVVGETGCGKSVMALAVLGLLPGGARRTSGQVLLSGTDLAACSPRELARLRGRRIGYVAQDPMVSLDPNFTVGAQIAEALRTHSGVSRPAARAKVTELLTAVNLPDPAAVARKYPHQLSGGMLQRCVIALALSGDPELLIADEPTTALDVTIQAEILALLRRLQEERQMAILLITHNWEVVERIADRTLVMYAGEIAELADADALLRGPQHPYARALLSSDPVRAVPGQPLPVIAGSVPAPGQWPAGCRFAPRCPEAEPECGSGPVAVISTGPGHLTRCLHARAEVHS